MKRLACLFTITIFLFSCKKSMNEFDQLSSSVRNNVKTNNGRIEVCHYDKETGTSHPITINENAWPAHQKHGDVLGNCSIETVTICDQTWMLKNLDVDHYSNGDSIPQVTDPAEWAALTTGAWCYFENDPLNGKIYGKMYNFYAITDPRGLTPTGWHVASLKEWETLEYDCLKTLEHPAGIAGELKEQGTTHWPYPNNFATNSTGFTALPGGYRKETGEFTGIAVFWWTSTSFFSHSNQYAHCKGMDSPTNDLYNAVAGVRFGFYVRCIKDQAN